MLIIAALTLVFASQRKFSWEKLSGRNKGAGVTYVNSYSSSFWIYLKENTDISSSVINSLLPPMNTACHKITHFKECLFFTAHSLSFSLSLHQTSNWQTSLSFHHWQFNSVHFLHGNHFLLFLDNSFDNRQANIQKVAFESVRTSETI